MVDESKLRDCVRDTRYPASVESILETARDNRCSMHELVELSHLPTRQYRSADEVIGTITSGARPS